MNDDIKKGIIQHLLKYHSGKWVNPAVAIMPYPAEAFGVLEELIEANIIERKYVYLEGTHYPLVRYLDPSWNRPQLKIMNGGKV